MIGILIVCSILFTFIFICEKIIKHNKTNGVVQEITSSEFTQGMVNIITHVVYKGKEIRNFCDQVPEYEVKYVSFDKIKKGLRLYKAHKNRYK